MFVDEERTTACGIRIDRYCKKIEYNCKTCTFTIIKALDTCPFDVDQGVSIDCKDASDLRKKFVVSWSDKLTSDTTSNLQHCVYMVGKTEKHCRVRKEWTRVIHNFVIYSGLSVSVTLSVSIDGKDTPRKITFVARTNVEQIKPKTSTHTPLLIGKVVKTLGTRHSTYIHFNTHTTHTQNKTTNKTTIITTTNKKIKKAHFFISLIIYTLRMYVYRPSYVCVCVVVDDR